jgi:glycosyltransferase involved in cell wall biosynthesis
MTRVSIIITCYNLGEYLPEALQSALAQTHPDLEVVLIDDGSTDPATIRVLDGLAPHPRLRVFRTANQGVARARNYGITQATGDYILPLDADDRIHADYAARAAAILDANPDVAFVGCHYRTFDLRQVEYRPAAYRLPEMLVENVVPISSMFRRSAWDEAGGYCPELNSIEDWDLWICMLERGWRGEVIPEILFEYRVRPNSNLSHIRKPEVYQQRMQLLYARHAGLFEQYRAEVLRLKDLQFAHQIAYAHWLEEQCREWQKVAEERLALIGQHNSARERHRAWWLMQIRRVQRVLDAHPDPVSRARALTAGGWRVLRRRLMPYMRRITARQKMSR